MQNKLGQGTLYFNGQKTMGVTDDVAIKDAIFVNEEPLLEIPKLDEISFTMNNVYVSTRTLLSLILGRPVSNNWLKMHGRIMDRKVSKKRIRRLRKNDYDW